MADRRLAKPAGVAKTLAAPDAEGFMPARGKLCAAYGSRSNWNRLCALVARSAEVEIPSRFMPHIEATTTRRTSPTEV